MAEPASRWESLQSGRPAQDAETHCALASPSRARGQRALPTSPRERLADGWTTPPTSLRFLLSHQRSALCHLSAGPPTGSGAGVSPQGHLSTLHLQFLSKYVTAFRVLTFDQGFVFSLDDETSESKGWESCFPSPGTTWRSANAEWSKACGHGAVTLET